VDSLGQERTMDEALQLDLLLTISNLPLEKACSTE